MWESILLDLSRAMAKVFTIGFSLRSCRLFLSSHYSCTNTATESTSSAEQMLQKLDNNLSFRQLFMLSLKYVCSDDCSLMS